MTLYTTYNRILNGMENPETYLKWLENRVTGNRNNYGLDTPIYLLDVLDKSGIQDALLLMDYCAQDVSALAKTMGIALARAFQTPWQTYNTAALGGKLDNLLTFAERCMDAQDVDTTRYDYCGDPIPGGGDVSVAQVETLIAEIKAIYDAWNYETAPLPQYTWVYVASALKTDADIPTSQQGHWAYSAERQIDWFADSLHAADVAFVATRNIAQAMAVDPDAFYDLSLELQQNRLDETPKLYYQKVTIWPMGSDTVLINHDAQAAKYSALAAITAARLAISSMGGLDSIALYCQRATSHAYSATYRTQARGMMRMRELGTFMVPYPAFPEGDPVRVMEQDVLDQAQNLRAALYRDQAYIESFDTSYEGSLSSSEFLLLEEAVRIAMKAKAAEVAGAHETSLQGSNPDLTSTIDGIIRAYIV
jgi:hypothetical protein